MKVAILVFPGSNCDHDCYHAYKHVIGCETAFVWHQETDLKGYDLVVVPGGFSYGDYLRSGAIARFSPVMSGVKTHVDRGGYVLGVCNGFQILTEAHLLPGALMRNASMKFICDNVHLKPGSDDTFVTSSTASLTAPLSIPIAHMDGAYMADEATLDRLEGEGRVAYYYCDPTGNVTPDANPNGAMRNIAGILSENKRVAGMMPHPERVAEGILGGEDGLAILTSIFEVAAKA